MPPYGRIAFSTPARSGESSTTCMRCPDLRAVVAILVAVAVPLASAAGPEEVRSEIWRQQKERHPALSAQDLASGSAAFDAPCRPKPRAIVPPRAAEASRRQGHLDTQVRQGPLARRVLSNGGRHRRGLPQYDPRVKRLVTLETRSTSASRRTASPHGRGRSGDDGRGSRLPALARRGRKVAVRATRRRPGSASRRVAASISRAWASRTTRAPPATCIIPGTSSATRPSPRPSAPRCNGRTSATAAP